MKDIEEMSINELRMELRKDSCTKKDANKIVKELICREPDFYI